ncbi:MAG: MlaC/ttg2D family ABC transporter substrate-binding protein [Primorskyibacter sp.]
MSRRHFMTATGAALTLPTAGWSLNTSDARTLISRLVNDINAAISSGKSERAMLQDFERIFLRFADTSYIAAYAMGADSRRASAAQKRAFTDAFTGYLARRYGARFREFTGGRFEVKTVRKVRSYYEVETTAYLRGEAPFAVNFHVSDRTGQDLFFNMYIEGINMLLAERSEVGAMLDKRRGNIDAMISDLKKAS